MKGILIGFLLFITVFVFGRNQHEVFVNFNTGNNMLKHNTVETITRDNLGYVWIGTNYGLYRIDGYKTQSYTHNPADTTSLSSNFIKSLYVDSDNDLWIGTIGGGLNKFNRLTNTFLTYYPSKKSIAETNKNITAITQDHNGKIWIGTTGNGVVVLDKKTGEILKIDLEQYDPYHRRSSNVNVLFTDNEGNIWVGLNQSEVLRIVPNSMEINFFGLSKDDPDYDNIGSIKGISQKADGTILVVTWNSYLYQINQSIDKKMKRWKEPSFFNNSLLSDIKVDAKNNIWISSWEKGLFKISSENDKLIHITRNLNYPGSLGSNALNKLYIDKYENLWVSTLDNGLSMLPIKEKMFKTLDLNTDWNERIKELNVYSIIKDHNNTLWIGTRGQGIWKHNLGTGVTKNYLSENCPGLNSNSILDLKLSNDGKIWIATDGRFVTLLDPITNKFTQINNRNDDWSQGVLSIDDDENFVWCGTWGGGIKKVNKKTLQYTSINFDEKDQFKNSILDLELQDTILWVANVGLGLIRYNTLNGNYRIYSKETNQKEFPAERINDIFIENSNSLWISTDGGGLYHFSPDTEKFYNVTNEYELNSNVIQSSLTDKNGNIWAATISGISHIAPSQKLLCNFNNHNGLLTNQMNKSAIFFDKEENTIYTGSVEGVNYFNPDNIVIDSTVNNVVFTEISVMGTTLTNPNNSNLLTPIDVTSTVHLYPSEKIFTIHFSSMDFTSSVKSRYYYKLEGFDKDWVETPFSKNYVQYTNLYPGDYTLKVKTCNSDGICSNDETSIEIIVHPAFWQTFLFKLLIMLVVLLAVYIYSRNKYASLINAKRKLEIKVLQRTEEIQNQKEQIENQNLELALANQAKDKFFSIISHDLKNPIASIDQLIELIIMQHQEENTDDRISMYLDMLKKTSQHSLNLLEDLLVWARTQTNRIKIDKTTILLDDLFSEVENFCRPMAQNKNLELIFPIANQLKVNADKNTILTVLRNLVTNAIKFSNQGDQIKILVEDHQQKYHIKVIDNGIGISESEKKKLFKVEHFVSKKGTSGETGTGLGLILCYEFLTLNGEQIWVESEKGKGSTFIFSLQKA